MLLISYRLLFKLLCSSNIDQRLMKQTKTVAATSYSQSHYKNKLLMNI